MVDTHKDVIDVDPIESNKKATAETKLDPLRAWAFLVFFLPYCRKVQSQDIELDNWFANQGLLNLIAWCVGGLVSGSVFFAFPFWGFVVQIFNLLILANAFYGVISYYQGKRVKMLVYGDIKLIKSKVADPA